MKGSVFSRPNRVLIKGILALALCGGVALAAELELRKLTGTDVIVSLAADGSHDLGDTQRWGCPELISLLIDGSRGSNIDCDSFIWELSAHEAIARRGRYDLAQAALAGSGGMRKVCEKFNAKKNNFILSIVKDGCVPGKIYDEALDKGGQQRLQVKKSEEEIIKNLAQYWDSASEDMPKQGAKP